MPALIAHRPDNPLIVQSDRTLLLEVSHPAFEDVRDELARFAELVKSPEHIHTYRITPLSLWNASASGVTCGEIAATLERWSKYPVPQNLLQEIQDHGTRYGKLRLVNKDGRLALEIGVIQALAEDLCKGLMTRDPLSQTVHHSKPQMAGLALAAMARTGLSRLGARP